MFVSEDRPIGRTRVALLAGSSCLKLGYGRFMQTDPIGYDAGLNWYNYVGGDPINYRDPTGLTQYCADNTVSSNGTIEACDGHGGPGDIVTDGGGGGGSPGFGGFGGFGGNGGATPGIGGGGGLLPAPMPASSPLLMPQRSNSSCPSGDYKTYALGGSATIALFAGINVSVSFGFSLPKSGNIFGLQYFGGGQVSGMLGIGAFAGAGATFSKGTNSGPMKNFDSGGFGYGEADAGWGFAVGGSAQGSRGSSSGSVGLPIPKVGAGYGAYAGVGVGGGATAATTPFCALGQ